MIWLLLSLWIAVPANAQEGDALAAQAKKLALDAETWPSGTPESAAAWEQAADAYRRWLVQNGSHEDSGRMRYGYASALLGAGHGERAFDVFVEVLDAAAVAKASLVVAATQAGEVAAALAAAAEGEQRARWLQRRVEILRRGLEVAPDADPLTRRRALADALVAAGASAEAVDELRGVLAAGAEGLLREQATYTVLELLRDASAAELAAFAEACGVDGAVGPLVRQRCAEASEAAIVASMTDAAIPPGERAAGLMAWCRAHPASARRAELLAAAAESYGAAGDESGRRAALEQLVEHYPLADDARAHTAAVARSYAAEGKASDALQWWFWLLQQHPGDAEATDAAWELASSLRGAPAVEAWEGFLLLCASDRRAGKASKALARARKEAP